MLQRTPNATARPFALTPAAWRGVDSLFPTAGQLGRRRLARWYPRFGDLPGKPPPRDEGQTPRIGTTLERAEHVPRTAPQP